MATGATDSAPSACRRQRFFDIDVYVKVVVDDVERWRRNRE
jgi:hypothetical protein